MFTLQDVEKDSMKCSKCGRCTKGHPKLLGDDCQLLEMSETEIETMQLIEGTDSNTNTEKDMTRDKDMDDNVKDYASGGRVPGEKLEESPVIMELTFQMSAFNSTLQTLARN